MKIDYETRYKCLVESCLLTLKSLYKLTNKYEDNDEIRIRLNKGYQLVLNILGPEFESIRKIKEISPELVDMLENQYKSMRTEIDNIKSETN